MKQFIIKTKAKNGVFSLSGRDYRYLVLVRRMKKGDALNVLLPNGESAVLVINKVLQNKLTLNLASIPVSPCDSLLDEKTSLILAQAMPKGSKLDLIVRQAGEIGIAKVIPFFSKHCAPGSSSCAGRTDRLRRIVKEALQQSGSKTFTEVLEPINIEGIFEYWRSIKDESLGLLFYEKARELLSNNMIEKPFKKIFLVIGPEGGFAAEEVDEFSENGFKSISLGCNILRVETASLYAASAIQTLLCARDRS